MRIVPLSGVALVLKKKNKKIVECTRSTPYCRRTLREQRGLIKHYWNFVWSSLTLMIVPNPKIGSLVRRLSPQLSTPLSESWSRTLLHYEYGSELKYEKYEADYD